ncbi:MAG: hypothetical protein ACLP9L_21845 [Thermoguttaceae bacterium]
MASGTISTRPQAENAPTQGRYEDFIQKRVEHTRRQVRLVDVATSIMLLAIASLLFFLVVAVLDQWVFHHGLSFLARLGLFAVWIAGAGAFIWRFLVPPLANRINPVFAAQTIEQGRPMLKNSLINFLLLRSHPQDLAPVVYRAMEHRAAADLLKVPVDHALDRGRVVHISCVLAAVVTIFALYLALSPKNPLVSAGRVLWPWSSVPAPTRVHIEDVSPGDKIVFTDDREPIVAQVTGLRDGEEVALLVSTADGQVVDDRVVMTRADDANHYRCELPPGSGGFQQDTYYRITAGDATTPQYKLEVQIAPTIIIDRIDYHFPPYTGQDDRTIRNQGDIKALEGTRVTIHANANLDIQEARIDLNCAGLQTLPMTTNGTKATGQFTLALDPDKPGKAQYSGYQILFTGTNGHSVRRPVRYNIDVDRDLPPDIEIVEPRQEEVNVSEDGQLRIRVHAFDPDFALRYVTLQADREGRAEGEVQAEREAQKLGLPVLLDRTKPNKAWPKPFDGEYIFRPSDWNLKAGDLVRYWATAEDNKEPQANLSKSPQRTIHIVGSGQSGRQDPQNQPQGADGRQQQNGQNPSQGGMGNKAEQGQGDAASEADGSKDGNRTSDPKSKQGGKEKSSDSKPGDDKDQGKPDSSGGQGKDQTSSDPSKGQKGGEPDRGEAGDQANNNRTDPETQKADAIKKMLDDKQQQDKDQQGQGDQSKNDQNSNQKPDSTQSPDNQQGGQPQNGGQDDQGGKPSQGNSGKNKDQSGTGNQKPQEGNQPQQGGKPDSGQNQSGQSQQGGQDKSNGHGNQNPSPEQGNSGNPSNGGSQPKGEKDAGNQNRPSQQSDRKGSESKPSAGSKEDKNSAGQAKEESKQPVGEQHQSNQSASGGSKSEKPQSGGQPSKDQSAQGGNPSSAEKNQSGGQPGKNQSAKGGNPPNSATKQPGGKGPGDDQTAENGPRPEPKNSADSAGADGQNMPGDRKSEEKPKDDRSNSQGGGQGSQAKQEAKQGSGGQSDGGRKPKTSQDEQEGSGGDGNKPNGEKPPSNKAGTADSEHEGGKDPGKSGKSTQQDSSGAPKPQVDRERSERKTGDAREAMDHKSDNAQSPGNSPHDSKNTGDTRGDHKGGGGAGGGQRDEKAGKGAAGAQKPADEGGAVSDEHGEGATGEKAGDAVRSKDLTGSSQKQTGKGDGEKHESADDQSAKTDSQRPQGDPRQNAAENEDKSSGGPSGAQSPQHAGKQGSGMPAGGSQPNSVGSPPAASHQPEGQPDAADIEFSKKQVDLALEHLKEQMAKQKPELLDRLGWTKEEAQKFLENLKKLKDSAQQPGSEGEAGKKAYNEFLKNLDLHPYGTQIRGGQTKTDDLRNVRDSGQTEPPSEWADLYRAYSRSTAGQK